MHDIGQLQVAENTDEVTLLLRHRTPVWFTAKRLEA